VQALRSIAARLCNIEIYFVILVIVLSMASARLLPFALGVIVFLGVSRLLAKGHFSVQTPLNIPIIGMSVLLLMALWASPRPEIANPQVMRAFNGIGLYFALVNSNLSSRKITLGLLAMGLVLASVSPFVVEWFPGEKLPFIPSWLYQMPKIVADTINPNPLATVLVITFSMGLGVLYWGYKSPSSTTTLITVPFANIKPIHEKGVVIAGLILVLFDLLISQSRGGLLALGGALVTFALVAWRRVRWVVVALIVAVGGVVWQFKLLPDLFARTPQGGPSALQIRLTHWTRALELIQQMPFSGVGMGIYPDLVDKGPRGVTGLTAIERTHAHNMILQIALDLGVLGALIWLIMLGVVIFLQFKTLRNRTAPNWQKGVALGLITAQVGMFIANMFDSTLWGIVRSAPYLWAIWALGVINYKKPTSL
jgi:O-antigen ligase